MRSPVQPAPTVRERIAQALGSASPSTSGRGLGARWSFLQRSTWLRPATHAWAFVAPVAREAGVDVRDALGDRVAAARAALLSWASIASDVARYASDRAADAPREAADDIARAIDRIILDAANRLVHVKKDVAVAIADEKRLRRLADDERAAAARWNAEATRPDAERGGAEARRLASGHERAAEALTEEAAALAVVVGELRTRLAALAGAIDRAKHAKNAMRTRAHARRALRQIESETRRVLEVERLLGRLAPEPGPPSPEGGS